jgi:hypothetical protein
MCTSCASGSRDAVNLGALVSVFDVLARRFRALMVSRRAQPVFLVADLLPWQIKSAHLGCGKLTRRANHFGLSEMKVKPRNQKYFCFRLTQISSLIRTVSSHQRGDRASSRARGGMRWTRQHQASECKPDE